METSKTEKRDGELTLREAMLPAKVSGWRAKLSTKAKQEKRFGFYSLYGLISHAETLKGAWQQVRANGGAAGVDRISIEQIERQGPEQWLEALGQELQEQTYRCEAVRRVYIPKANGKLRPLAESTPQGMDELLSAWTTSQSLSTAQPLRTATALSAPAPQQPKTVETGSGANHLWVLQEARADLPVNAACNKPARKPDAGNPPVRFDEGEGSVIGPSLLYWSSSSSISRRFSQRTESDCPAIILSKLV